MGKAAIGFPASMLWKLFATRMTSIDPHRRLAAALQGRADRLRTAPAPAGQQPQSVESSSQQVLAARLRAIAPDDPQRRQKAGRAYLESELARELGRGLVNDPAFAQMVEAVHSQMQEDAEVAGLLEQAAEHLLSKPSPS